MAADRVRKKLLVQRILDRSKLDFFLKTDVCKPLQLLHHEINQAMGWNQEFVAPYVILSKRHLISKPKEGNEFWFGLMDEERDVL